MEIWIKQAYIDIIGSRIDPKNIFVHVSVIGYTMCKGHILSQTKGETSLQEFIYTKSLDKLK